MTSLIPSLESFKISNDNQVDITDEFFNITSKVKYSTIIKSNNFTLLHGTHALEILNPKLDTFLLNNLKFDINIELNLKQSTSIISNQLKSLTCWLGQNIGLPNSLLSCEYISQILENYSKFGNLNNFKNLLLKNDWRSIVIKFSILIISITKFILELSIKSQIYEDEDLNTTTMNLDWFFLLNNNDIFKITMISNKTWLNLKNSLNNNDDEEIKYFNFIKDSFQILQTLLSLDSILQWKIPLFKLNENNSIDFLNKYNNKLLQLEKIIEILNKIDLLNLDLIKPPIGCFNLNSQIKFDNQSPPKELKIIESNWNDCILNLTQLFNDLIDILKIFKSKNIIEFIEWLKYLENKRNNSDLNEINGLHIVSRILFFSMINQNNNNNNNNSDLNSNFVFNINNLTFKDLFWNYIKEFALNNSKIDKEIQNNKNTEIFQQIDYYLDAVSLFWKESLFLPTLNPSRQRQFKCKELKYWNMRQIETGSLEDYFSNLNFYKSNEKFYPLTFIIIYFKLKSIQQIILKSIELNLFKDVREYLSVYYQLTLISFQLNQQIDNLILMINSINKKSLNYLNFLKNENNLIYQLSLFKSKIFEILSYFKFNELPKNLIKNSFITEELLFNLQWKQLNGINDPKMLEFKYLKIRLKEIILEIENNFKSFDKLNSQEMNDSINDFNQSLNNCNLIMNNQLNWFDELKNIKLLEFELLQNELHKSKNDINKLIDLIKLNKSPEFIKENYNLKIVQLGRHIYFPGVKLIKKE